MKQDLVTVTHALLSSESIANLLRQNYSFDGLITCSLEKSAPNPVYRIVNNERIFALKIFRSDTDLEFQSEYAKFLGARGVHVAKPVLTDTGASFFFSAYNNLNFFGVLHEYICGRELVHSSPSDARAYGEELARLHVTSDEFVSDIIPPAFDPIHRLNQSLQYIIDELCVLNLYDQVDLYRQIAMNLEEKLTEVSAQFTNTQLLHGDTHGGNAKYSKGNVWFFDFEGACLGTVEWDVACFKWGSRVGKRADSFRYFIEGYKRVVSTPSFSEDVVRYLSALKEFEVVSNHLKMSKILGSWFITERYLVMRLDALRSLISK